MSNVYDSGKRRSRPNRLGPTERRLLQVYIPVELRVLLVQTAEHERVTTASLVRRAVWRELQTCAPATELEHYRKAMNL